VFKNNGLLILNISDHIRNGKQIEVSKWHVDILKGLGFSLIEQIEVKTHRQRMGKNSELRVEYEYVFIFRK
jgi:hypothetical protein